MVLKNGDTLTGAVVKKDGGKLVFKSEFLGEVSMPWSAVKSLHSDETLTVVLPGGETVAGKIATTGDNLEVAAKTTPLATVDAIRNPAEQHSWERIQHPGLLELWTGFFDVGLALARGNARADTLTTSFNATRITRTDKIALDFKEIHSTARVNNITDTVASAIRFGWTYNRDITSRLFVATINDYEHDRFQNLDLRFVAGAGLGVNLIKKDNTVLSVLGGANYNRENFLDHVHRNSAEANFGNDFVHKFSAATNVTQSFRFFTNLSDTGNYRVNFDISGVTAIKKWLGWHLTASDRFLSNPVFGHQRNDVLLSTGLRITFAH